MKNNKNDSIKKIIEERGQKERVKAKLKEERKKYDRYGS